MTPKRRNHILQTLTPTFKFFTKELYSCQIQSPRGVFTEKVFEILLKEAEHFAFSSVRSVGLQLHALRKNRAVKCIIKTEYTLHLVSNDLLLQHSSPGVL